MSELAKNKRLTNHGFVTRGLRCFALTHLLFDNNFCLQSLTSFLQKCIYSVSIIELALPLNLGAVSCNNLSPVN